MVRAISPGGFTTTLSFDASGVYPESLVDSEGRLTQFVYNDRKLQTEQIDASGRSDFLGFDDAGNRLFRRSEGSRWSVDTIDAKQLVTQRRFSDGSRLDLVYDTHRNLMSVSERTSEFAVPRVVSFLYDASDRVTRVTYPNTKFINYRYDSQGRQDQISTSDGLKIDYRYDSLSRLSTVRRNDVLMMTYQYDTVGRLKSRTAGNSTSTVYTYDSLDRVTRIEHLDTAGAVSSFNSYTYDQSDRVATMTDVAGTMTYAYDLDGQLVQAIVPDLTVADYRADSVGNRRSFTVNELNQYLTGPEGERYEYDADGNLTSVSRLDGSITTYHYDGRGRFAGITTPSEIWQFEYDPLGNRSAVIRNGVRTDLLLDAVGGIDSLVDVLAEYNGAVVTNTYVTGSGLEAVVDSSGAGAFYRFDLTGNTTALTAQDGSVAASYRYLPFGEILSATGPGAVANKYTFNGQHGVAQRGTAGFDMRARLYDSTTGRFTQQDPIGLGGQDVNVYRFVGNDPVRFVDPSGLWNPITPIAAMLGSWFNFGRPPLPPAPAPVPPVVTPVVEGAIADTVVSGTEVVGAGAEAYSATVVETLGAMATRAVPVVTVALLLTETGEAETISEYQLDVVYVGRLIETQTRLHPRLKEKIQDFVSKNGGQPTFKDAIDLLICVRQGEAREKTGTQATSDDPNEIVGPLGQGIPGFLTTPAVLPYTIYFQNKPSASAPAQEVFVTQQLDADLDWESFELISFGWGANLFDVPSGLKSWETRIQDPISGLVVDVSARFSAANGQLSWTFRSLDPVTFDLPWDGLAGFLPPDDASGRGQGFVAYSISPKIDASDGTEFTGQASIVFDTEAPIVTNVWRNTLDQVKPVSSVSPLPASTSTAIFSVTWSGSDGTGSGIASWDIFVSANDGPYTLWLDDVTTTTAAFTGQVGNTYRFYSVATDNVGHEQSMPLAAQAVTTISQPRPSITAPAATTQLMRPVIQWTPVADVQTYDLWITNLSTGQNPLIRTQVSATSYSPTLDLGVGKFRVWVRGHYSDNTYTGWSAQADFVINTQAAFRPIGANQATGFPAIEWFSVPGAAKYDLWIDSLSTGQTQYIRKSDVMTTSFVPAAEFPLGRYRMWVRTIDAGNNFGIWSAPADFTVLTRPTIVSPGLATFSATPQFTWNPVPGASRYDLWVERLSGGGSQYIRNQNISGTSFTPATAMPAGDYVFWVRAIGPGGPGRFSTGRALNIGGKPSALSPVGVTSDTTPVVTWTPVDGAARYDLWINRLDVPRAQLVRQTTLSTAEFETSLLPLGTYRIWVRAFTSGGATGDWSIPWTFSIDTTATTAPTMLLPSAATFSTQPTFTWTALRGATHYLLYVHNLTNSQVAIQQQNITGTSFTSSTPLSAGPYRAWVRAYAGNDVLGDFSAPRDFGINAPPVLSVNTVGIPGRPKFTWSPVQLAARYELLVNRLDVVTNGVIDVTDLTGVEYIPATPLGSGTYRGWIRAVSGSGVITAYSTPVDFVIAETSSGDDETLLTLLPDHRRQPLIPHLLSSAADSFALGTKAADPAPDDANNAAESLTARIAIPPDRADFEAKLMDEVMELLVLGRS